MASLPKPVKLDNALSNSASSPSFTVYYLIKVLIKVIYYQL